VGSIRARSVAAVRVKTSNTPTAAITLYTYDKLLPLKRRGIERNISAYRK
jgi:hypothetical protein